MIMSSILEAIIHAVATIFQYQGWYWAIFYVVLLIGLAAFSIVIFVAAFSLVMNPAQTFLLRGLNVAAGILLAAATVALWWCYYTLARKTAVAK